MGTRGFVAALVLAAWPAAPLFAEGVQTAVVVYYPKVPWQLRYDLEGVVEDYNNHKTGLSSYATARSQSNGMLVSVQISAAEGARSAAQCREREHKHNRLQKALAGAEIRLDDAQGVDMEVLVPLGSDRKVVSRHVHRFWLRDGVCAKMHASKTPFAESHRPVFDKLLQSVRFEPAAATVERAFLVPGRGTLIMKVPLAWGLRAAKPDAAAPRDIEFMDSGSDYKLLLTVVPEARTALKGEATPKAFVESARDAAKPNAVEPDPQLVPLKGRDSDGYYFFVTDRNLVNKPPRREDWKYLTQGASVAGGALLFFSIFSNVKDSLPTQAGLRAIGEARLVPAN